MHLIPALICLGSFASVFVDGDDAFTGRAEKRTIMSKRSISEMAGEHFFRFIDLHGDRALKHLVKREVELEMDQDQEQFSTPSDDEQELNEVAGNYSTETNQVDDAKCQLDQVTDCMITILKLAVNFNDTEACTNLDLVIQCTTEMADKCLKDDRKSQINDILEKLESITNDMCSVVSETTPFEEPTEDSVKEATTVKLDEQEADRCIAEFMVPSVAMKCQKMLEEKIKENLYRLHSDGDWFCFGFAGASKCVEDEMLNKCHQEGIVKYYRKQAKNRLDEYTTKTGNPHYRYSKICSDYFSEYE